MSKLVKRTSDDKLAIVEDPLASARFTRYIRVFDRLAVSPYITLDGELVEGREPGGADRIELGGFLIVARSKSTWESIVELLEELESSQPEQFHRLMRQCVARSNGPREADGFHDLLDDDGQAEFDLAADRDAEREEQGYVLLGDARAFLQSARRTPIEVIARPPGIVSAQSSRFEFVRAHLEQHPDGEGELAQLANTLMSGCSIQGRAFSVQDARNGAFAICNLGCENRTASIADISLIAAFQTGFAILHERVGMRTAHRLVEAIDVMECRDRDIQFDLHVLKRELTRAIADRTPWKALNALEVLMMLDTPTWAAIVALLDECPVMHAAIEAPGQHQQTIGASDIEFISNNTLVRRVAAFLATLEERLMS